MSEAQIYCYVMTSFLLKIKCELINDGFYTEQREN